MIPHARIKFCLSAGLYLAGVFTLVAVAAQTPVQLHPAPPPEVERPIIVAVLADGFTAAQEADFNEAAANFFTYGLLADPHFAARKDLITIKTIFKPVATAGASQFGFVLGTGITNCSISWNDSNTSTNTAALIEVAAAPANPTDRHKVVIGNHNYNFGCSDDSWAYIAVGAVGEQVIHHEFGHLIGGLKDEYHVPDLENTTYPGVFDDVNCSTLPTPHWMNAGLPAPPPAIANLPGCALHGQGIVHPYESCRMGSHGTTFCHVCDGEMKKTWDYYKNLETSNPTARAPSAPTNVRVSGAGFLVQPTPPTPPTQNRMIRILVNVNRLTGATNVLTATNGTGRVVARERRLGPYVYDVSEQGKTLAFGVISGDPFETHGYRGGASQHTRVPGEPPRPGDTATMLVTIPGEWKESLIQAGRTVEITFYRLAPQVKDAVIAPPLWDKLKADKQAERFAQVSAKQLTDQLNNLKPTQQAK